MLGGMKKLAVTALAGGAIGLLSFWSYGRITALPRLGVEITPKVQRIIADKSGRKVLVFYKVRNNSDRPLSLGPTSTTCGCSVASISPKLLQTGETAVVSVEGVPPPYGEKQVRVTIETSLTELKPIELDLVMVSNTPLPYIISSSGGIQFGELSHPPPTQSLWFTTVEDAAEKPWLLDPRTSSESLSLEGGMIEDRVVGGNAYRKYQYTVRLNAVAPRGDLTEAIVFEHPNTPRHEVDVHAIVRPAVFAVPSTIFATVQKGEDSPTLTVRLKSLDANRTLSVTPVGAESLPIAIEKVKEENANSTFRISLKPGISRSVSETLTFQTNAPEVPQVRVPLSIKFDEDQL